MLPKDWKKFLIMGVSRRKPPDDNNAQKHIGDVKKGNKKIFFSFF
jgi:hypothetical protein